MYDRGGCGVSDGCYRVNGLGRRIYSGGMADGIRRGRAEIRSGDQSAVLFADCVYLADNTHQKRIGEQISREKARSRRDFGRGNRNIRRNVDRQQPPTKAVRGVSADIRSKGAVLAESRKGHG